MTLTESEAKHIQPTYARQPIHITRGSGCRVWDAEGKEYLDCLAGIAVNVCGHCHPRVVEAIKTQAETLIHTSNLYYTEPQIRLAEELVKLTGLDRIFFCNSGTEAAEAAMKLARRATGKTDFIAAENSFHGRTLGALSLTHTEKYRKPFEPLIPGVTFVKYNDASAMEAAITPDTAAVFLEAVQGEGGVKIASKEYLKEVREICDARDVLLIIDEVQTGFGRTGAWFAYEHYGIKPDIITMAKALGSGFPIGAMASRDDLQFERGDHGATFAGGPLACAASLATIDVIRSEGLVERSRVLGARLKSGLQSIESLAGNRVREVRGMGLMVGRDFESGCGKLVDMARERGVLLNCTADTVLRFLPPLTISEVEIEQVLAVIEGIGAIGQP
ncbi:MAG TPA: acetylornithine transaminase [Methanosarcinales archaeon]|nr:acetylornithine transaminase [Methanosarcinales archaeon]